MFRDSESEPILVGVSEKQILKEMSSYLSRHADYFTRGQKSVVSISLRNQHVENRCGPEEIYVTDVPFFKKSLCIFVPSNLHEATLFYQIAFCYLSFLLHRDLVPLRPDQAAYAEMLILDYLIQFHGINVAEHYCTFVADFESASPQDKPQAELGKFTLQEVARNSKLDVLEVSVKGEIAPWIDEMIKVQIQRDDYLEEIPQMCQRVAEYMASLPIKKK